MSLINEIIDILREEPMTETEITNKLVERGVKIEPLYHHPSGYYWSPRIIEVLRVLEASGIIRREYRDGKIVYRLVTGERGKSSRNND